MHRLVSYDEDKNFSVLYDSINKLYSYSHSETSGTLFPGLPLPVGINLDIQDDRYSMLVFVSLDKFICLTCENKV